MYSRSRILGLVGVPVVAVITVLIAFSVPETESNPKGAYALIFGVIGAFVFLLLFVQGRETAAAERADSMPALESGTEVEDPTVLRPVDLWAALAVAPIGDVGPELNAAMWGVVRSSIRTGWIICTLIFVCVPMTYLLETFVPLLIGAALIVLVAVASLLRLFAGGGAGRDENLEATLAPLGLTVGEESGDGRPITGTRHGRRVEVLMEEEATTIRVACHAPAFKARSSEGGVVLRKGEPGQPMERALLSVRVSDGWKNVTVEGSDAGIRVRRSQGGDGWLADLWLAEHLADAAGDPA